MFYCSLFYNSLQRYSWYLFTELVVASPNRATSLAANPMEVAAILLALIVRNTIANDIEDKVDYSKVVRWERRTLVCRTRNTSNSTHLPADCRLKIGTDETEVSTRCFVEAFEQRSLGGRKSIGLLDNKSFKIASIETLNFYIVISIYHNLI
uniref:Secreted protein n=1 Tax=Ascaris lumbricoides TaxID=6252 RepID=A0A0M3I844_ASCLU